MWHLERTSVKDICNTFDVSCMAVNKIAEDYKVFPFWKNRELQKRIRDWFFPCNIETAADKQVSNEQTDTDRRIKFFDTLLAYRGEQCMFERALEQRLCRKDY